MNDTELRTSIDAWFAQYDAYSKTGDVERMADMALFPIHVITDDSAGNGHAENWGRAEFVEIMSGAMAGTPPDMEMTTTRTPFFLSNSMVTVITNATVTAGGQRYDMCYADVLVKIDGEWKFQTMAQSGWGDMLKARPNAIV